MYDMKRKEEVEEFLRQFKPKMSVWGVLFLDRGKNVQSLKDLGLTPQMREEVVREIVAEDFCEMIYDTVGHLGEMWVFGRDCNGRELYIKISLGQPDSKTICISFHIAEHPMNYAFK